MPTPVIVKGDRTSHGGEVISGSPVTDTHGKYISRVGDYVTCPKKGHGTNQIVSGDLTFVIDGQAVARHGDKTACGATLLATQTVTTDDPGGGAGQATSAVPATETPASTQSEQAASQGLADATASNETDPDEPMAIRFRAIDPETGEPIPKCVYLLTREDGTQTGGVTDSDGYTSVVESSRPQQVAVHFVFKSAKGENLEREDLG